MSNVFTLLRSFLRMLLNPLHYLRGNDGLTATERRYYTLRYNAGPGYLPPPDRDRVDRLYELANKVPGRTWHRASSAKSA
jgi:hypothetical protein